MTDASDSRGARSANDVSRQNEATEGSRRTDPRGPLRTVEGVESTDRAHLVTFAECGHTGRTTRHMASPRVGESVRCFACRADAQSEGMRQVRRQEDQDAQVRADAGIERTDDHDGDYAYGDLGCACDLCDRARSLYHPTGQPLVVDGVEYPFQVTDRPRPAADYVTVEGDTYAGESMPVGTLLRWDASAGTHYPAPHPPGFTLAPAQSDADYVAEATRVGADYAPTGTPHERATRIVEAQSDEGDPQWVRDLRYRRAWAGIAIGARTDMPKGLPMHGPDCAPIYSCGTFDCKRRTWREFAYCESCMRALYPHESEPCAGTGDHAGQSADACDECASSGEWVADVGADLPPAAPACECSEDYGPCERHCEVLVVRQGAAVRTADESTLQLCADLVECGAELSATGRIDLARLEEALDASRDPVSGCAWFDGEADGEAARDLARQLEADAGDLWITHDDGYVIVRPSPDCPLLAD